MSEQRENKLIEAVALPPMITIPLPPRERRKRKNQLTFFPNLISQLRKAPVFHRSAFERRRSREFGQALVTAIAVNALIAVLFMLIWINPAVEEVDHSIKVTVAESPLDESSSENEESSAAARASIKSTAPPPARMVTTTAMQELSFEEVTEPALGDIGYDPMAMTLNFGNSLTPIKIQAAQNGYAIDERGKKSGRGKGAGFGFSQATGIFSSPGTGDGSGMVLFLDNSGSMEEVSNIVSNYVSLRFKKSVATRINGCAIKEGSRVIQAFRNQEFRENRTEYYFICDLQDGVTMKGLEELREIVMNPGSPKKLHVVSFGRPVTLGLGNLIRESGGTFKRMQK